MGFFDIVEELQLVDYVEVAVLESKSRGRQDSLTSVRTTGPC